MIACGSYPIWTGNRKHIENGQTLLHVDIVESKVMEEKIVSVAAEEMAEQIVKLLKEVDTLREKNMMECFTGEISATYSRIVGRTFSTTGNMNGMILIWLTDCTKHDKILIYTRLQSIGMTS